MSSKNQALADLRSSRRGTCPGCSTSGSWDETTSGTSDVHAVVWPGCDMHHQATGTPIRARAFAICAAEAKRRGLTVDGLWEALQGEPQCETCGALGVYGVAIHDVDAHRAAARQKAAIK